MPGLGMLGDEVLDELFPLWLEELDELDELEEEDELEELEELELLGLEGLGMEAVWVWGLGGLLLQAPSSPTPMAKAIMTVVTLTILMASTFWLRSENGRGGVGLM